MTTVSADKDPQLLRGADAWAHQLFQSFDMARGRVASTVLDKAVTVVTANTHWPAKFRNEVERLQAVLPRSLVPEVQHIGSTAVPGLDGKPVIDIMVGLSELNRIGELVAMLEGLGHESLGEAGVPGRWAMRRREAGSGFNISIIGFGGARWRQNLAVRELLRADPEAARRYAAAKWDAVKAGATTLFAYSDQKRAAIEAVAAAAERRSSTSDGSLAP